jgi:hypothetical protein
MGQRIRIRISPPDRDQGRTKLSPKIRKNGYLMFKAFSFG